VDVRLTHRAVHPQPLGGDLAAALSSIQDNRIDLLPCRSLDMLECRTQLVKAHHLAHADAGEIEQKIAICDTNHRLAVRKVFYNHNNTHPQYLFAAITGSTPLARATSAQVFMNDIQNLWMLVQEAVNRIVFGSVLTNHLLFTEYIEGKTWLCVNYFSHWDALRFL